MIAVIPNDVAARWRLLSSQEEQVAGVLIGDALSMIRSRWPDFESRAEPSEIVRVVAGMVKRAMIGSESEGLESQTQVGGPFSQTTRFANPAGALYLTAEDRFLFEPEARTPRARVGWLA